MSEKTSKRQKRKVIEECSECARSNESTDDVEGSWLKEQDQDVKRVKVPNVCVNENINVNEHGKSQDSGCTAATTYIPSIPPKRAQIRRKPGKDPNKTVNVAVSSRALFDFEEEHQVFKEKGLKEYIKHQVRKENEPLKPGSAFPFIKALTNVNNELKKINPEEEELFSVTLMSKNSAQIGIRLQKSIDEYPGLKIQRMALTGGTSPADYLKAFNTALFLTSEEEDVQGAIRRGFPAAVMSSQVMNPPSDTQLRVAFDLDAVLFSDESERVYKTNGLDAFLEYEKKNRNNPLPDGPLKPFALALGKMQKKFVRSKSETCPIRTFLVTSRDAEVGERALKTLRHWGLEIDESFFMAGAPKSDLLVAINPHIFFDDQKSHIDGARKSGTPSGHVLSTHDPRYDKKERELAKSKLFS